MEVNHYNQIAFFSLKFILDDNLGQNSKIILNKFSENIIKNINYTRNNNLGQNSKIFFIFIFIKLIIQSIIKNFYLKI